MNFGHRLLESPELLTVERVAIESTRRDTKDYAGGQVVFALTLESLTKIAMLESSKQSIP
jgi:hypothetical protein